MPRLSSPTSRALAGLVLVACSVYEVPNASPDAPESSGGGGGGGNPGGAGGSTVVTGGKAQTAGTMNAGGMVTTGGSAEPVPGGGTGDVSTAGGAGGAGGDPTSMGADGGAGGVPEVTDGCPDDPAKTAPGVCGCGLPDVATALLASCTSLTSKLLHRYDFEGTGTTVADRVGASDGMLMGGASLSKLAGRGVVQLGGGMTGAYVDLPNGLISSLPNASFEAWITWGGGSNFQRVFDFGDSDNAPPENNPKLGKTYLFVSPKTSAGFVTLGYSLNSSGQEQLAAGSAALSQALSQVVAVVDGTGDALTLYVNGAQVATRAWTGALSSINDVNVWLGRSQYNSDPELTAVYHEFRIYGAALSAIEVATAFKAGTDPDFMPK